MAILHSCCCWNNVRTGSLAAAVYTLVWFHHYWWQPDSVTEDIPLFSVLYGWFLVTMVICILLFITSILVFIALNQNNRFLLLPWLAATVTMVCIDTAVLIYQCVIFGLLTFNVIQMVIWLALTLLNVYCIMCVVSQYQELKAGRGTIDYIRSQRIFAMVYRPAIQQVHITQGPIVMTCPGIVTSSTQVRSDQQGQPAVTTTVMVSPPEYSVASSQLPRYSVNTTQDEAHEGVGEPLLNNISSSALHAENKNVKDIAPPPPYQP